VAISSLELNASSIGKTTAKASRRAQETGDGSGVEPGEEAGREEAGRERASHPHVTCTTAQLSSARGLANLIGSAPGRVVKDREGSPRRARVWGGGGDRRR